MGSSPALAQPSLFQRLADELSYGVLVPGLVLLVLFTLFVAVLLWAQLGKNSFNAANFLRDEHGKESATRLFGFIALAIHSWWVVTMVFQKESTIDHFIWYGVIWAGTPAIIILAQRWGGTLPFASGGRPEDKYYIERDRDHRYDRYDRYDRYNRPRWVDPEDEFPKYDPVLHGDERPPERRPKPRPPRDERDRDGR